VTSSAEQGKNISVWLSYPSSDQPGDLSLSLCRGTKPWPAWKEHLKGSLRS